ncbi:MAG: septum site-determining protein MinC [Clostridiaceae bacterium]|nr:septum site-determining protein MinC [Clostridiaceae bacterium]MBW4859593.1 septum site-determining protein MinC [Clostridiaceae bacterium]MBW4868562.1 septum site-determining protein MinC [Clostridiaceae bacterium]
MTQDLVVFKGTKDGVYIYIRDGNFESIKKELDIKLKKSSSFFKGGKIVDFKGKSLSNDELKELEGIVRDKYNLKIIEKKELKVKSFFKGIEEGMTKFIKTTLRSGQKIEYNGNVVIFGDVNPGSMVVAGGNIVVLGNLRGVAHAGYDGNKEAIVAAFALQPTQLRIANLISRRPDEDIEYPKWPEIAKIEGNEVIIERYLPKK